MRCSAPLLAAVMATAAAAAPDVFTIAARYTKPDGTQVTVPTWYGDGNMYVGSTVPAGVQMAFNYTANTTRSDLLYIRPGAPLTPGAGAGGPSPLSLPDPTFLALNAGSSASGSPLEFRHDAVGLGDDWILFFARYGSLILAQSPSGQLLSSFYLRPMPAGGAGDGGSGSGSGSGSGAEAEAPSIITWGKTTDADGKSVGQLTSLVVVA